MQPNTSSISTHLIAFESLAESIAIAFWMKGSKKYLLNIKLKLLWPIGCETNFYSDQRWSCITWVLFHEQLVLGVARPIVKTNLGIYNNN